MRLGRSRGIRRTVIRQAFMCAGYTPAIGSSIRIESLDDFHNIMLNPTFCPNFSSVGI